MSKTVKTVDWWVTRGWLHGDHAFLHGTRKQLKKKESFLNPCYTTWLRKTGIEIKSGPHPKHVRITFEEITDE